MRTRIAGIVSGADQSLFPGRFFLRLHLVILHIFVFLDWDCEWGISKSNAIEIYGACASPPRVWTDHKCIPVPQIFFAVLSLCLQTHGVPGSQQRIPMMLFCWMDVFLFISHHQHFYAILISNHGMIFHAPDTWPPGWIIASNKLAT